ncbi:hypothetical protein [Parachlamydia sp. AcF125]|uniref:hypothetical protein n=1 Tax=Parachlamydia sp. AcF125 TaxID=2795736 RepID=UPI001BC94C81|nr:hypothetical protein [Parachlamydia sp. AcF125]MBS4169057.1 hypothetical protein [Parachlamydia sp. AcF125]
MHPDNLISQPFFNALTPLSLIQPLVNREECIEMLSEEVLSPPPGFKNFDPQEEETGQIIALLKGLKRIDQNGWVTENYRRQFDFKYLAIEQKQFDLLFWRLWRANRLTELDSRDFNMYALFRDLLHRMQDLLLTYAGSGLKKKVLGESYFTKTLWVLTNGQKTELDWDTRLELNQKDCEDDYQFLFLNPHTQPDMLSEGTGHIVQFLESLVKKNVQLVRDKYLNNFVVKAPFFSLVSWANQSIKPGSDIWESINCDIAFLFHPNDCFFESKLSLSLNSLLEDNNRGKPLIPNGGFYRHKGELLAEDSLQGIVDFHTKILHARCLDDMNSLIFSKLIALISLGRRDDGHGFYYPQPGEKGTKSLPWQITDRFIKGASDALTIQNALQISSYLQRHYPHDRRMSLVMTYNACLCISQHVSSEVVDEIYKKILPSVADSDDQAFSIFELIDQGVRLGLSFIDVMQVHQCIALLALGVKKPKFKTEEVKIFLSKHEGHPAVKIQEGIHSVFIRFEPSIGYRTCLSLLKKDKKIARYLTAVMDAYFPQKGFLASEGSQLSPYSPYIKILLQPLQEEIRKQPFVEGSFISYLNYHLLFACQTCNLFILDLENIIQQFPFIYAKSGQNKKILLASQLENLLVFARIEPWFNVVGNVFDKFYQTFSWMEALAAINDPRLQGLAVKILKKSFEGKRGKIDSIHTLTHLLLPTNLELALEVFKWVKKGGNAETCLRLFLEFSPYIKDSRAQLVYEFLKEALPIFEKGTGQEFLLSFKEQVEEVFSLLLSKLFHSGYASYAYTLLRFLTEQKIFNTSGNVVWRSILRELLDNSQTVESLSLWKVGKNFKVWRQEDALNLAEYLFKNTPETETDLRLKTKALKDLCQFSCSDTLYERVRNLVLKILTNRQGKIYVSQLPLAYVPYLSKEELGIIQLNAVMDEIEEAQFLRAGESLLAIMSRMKRGSQLKDTIHFYFSRLMLYPNPFQDIKLLDITLKILKSQHGRELIEKTQKIEWVFSFIQKMSHSKKSFQFATLLHLFFSLVWQEEPKPSFSSQIEDCLEHILQDKPLSKFLKEVVQEFHLNLLTYSLTLSQKQTFFNLVQLLLSIKCFKLLRKRKELRQLEEYTLISLEKPSLPKEEVLGFHHLWKEVVAHGAKQKINLAIAERLISHLLNLSQTFLAIYWSTQLLLNPLTPSQIAVLWRLSGNLLPAHEGHFQKLLDTFYEKQWVDEKGKPLWKSLVKECLSQSQPQIVYRFIHQKGEGVVKELGHEAEKLLKFLYQSAQPQLSPLKAYIHLIAHAGSNPVLWEDLTDKVFRFGSAEIREQFLGVFKEKIIQEDILRGFPKEKFKCLMLCLPFFEKQKKFSAGKWVQDPCLAHFFEDPLLQEEKAQFYSHLLNSIQKKDPLAYVEMMHENMAFLVGRRMLEEASSDTINLLIHHPDPGLINQGCQALLNRFLENPTYEDEECLMALLQRSKREDFKNPKIIDEIVKLVKAYTQKLAIEYLLEVMELCATHLHPKIKAQLTSLQSHFFTTHGEDSSTILADWIESAPSLPCLVEFFNSPILEKFLEHSQINQLFAKALVKQLEKNPCQNSLRAFYDHFPKFSSFPTLKEGALKAFFNMLLDVDSFINQEGQFWRYLDTFSLLWMRQSTSPENYLHKWEQLSNQDKEKKLLLSIIHADAASLKTHLEEPLPLGTDPLIFERIFDFADILFALSMLQKENVKKNYTLAFGLLKFFIRALVVLASQSGLSEERKYEKTLEMLGERFVYLHPFIGKEAQLDEIFSQLELPKIAQTTFVRLYFYCHHDWPPGFSLTTREKMKTINELIPLLVNHPLYGSHQKAVNLFECVAEFCIQNFPLLFFSNFKYLLEKISEEDLSLALVNQFVEKLMKSPLYTTLASSTQVKIIVDSINLLTDYPGIRLKSLELFGKFAGLLEKADRLKFETCYQKMVKNYEHLKEFKGFKECSPYSFNFLHLYCHNEWPEAVIFKVSAEEKITLFKNIFELLIEGGDVHRGVALFIKHGHLLLLESSQAYEDRLGFILHVLRERKEVPLIAGQFEKLSSCAKERSLEIFEKIFNSLREDSPDQFLAGGAKLLSQAFHARIFTGNIGLFYQKMRLLGEAMVAAMSAGKLESYQAVFFPLLFLELGKTREASLMAEEQVMRLAEINHWQKEVGKALTPAGRARTESKFKKIASSIQNLKKEKNPSDFEKFAHRVESQLLKNLISLSLSANSSKKLWEIRSGFLQYIQEVICLRTMEEREAYGYELLLNCYRQFWERLERHGMKLADPLQQRPIFRSFILALMAKEDFTQVWKETAKGKECFAKIHLELFHTLLKAGIKIKPTDHKTRLLFYVEIFAFIIKALELKAFENHLEEFYDTLAQLQDYLSNEFLNTENSLTPKDENFLLSQIFLAVQKTWSSRDTLQERQKSYALLHRWLKICMHKKRLVEGIKCLQSELNVQVRIEKGEITQIIEIV